MKSTNQLAVWFNMAKLVINRQGLSYDVLYSIPVAPQHFLIDAYISFHDIWTCCSIFQVVLTLLVVIWGLRLGLFLLMRYVHRKTLLMCVLFFVFVFFIFIFETCVLYLLYVVLSYLLLFIIWDDISFIRKGVSLFACIFFFIELCLFLLVKEQHLLTFFLYTWSFYVIDVTI